MEISNVFDRGESDIILSLNNFPRGIHNMIDPPSTITSHVLNDF